MLLLAKHLRKRYSPEELEIHFYHYGGVGSFRYVDLLLGDAQALNYHVHRLEPRWQSEEQIARLYRINQFEEFGDFVPFEHVKMRIENELKLFEQLKPAIILTGFVLSARVSAKIAGIPYAIFIPSRIPPYDLIVDEKLSFLPDWMRVAIKTHLLPKRFLNRVFFWLLARIPYLVWQWRDLALSYGIKPIHEGIIHNVEGDYTLITDVPMITGVSEGELTLIRGDSYQYVGPMFAQLEMDTPEVVLNRIAKSKQEGKKVLYFAMGSSGKSRHVENILKALDSHLKNGDLEEIGVVVSPTKRLLFKFEEDRIRHRQFVEEMDSRILLTDLIPALQVNEMSDLAILHGGQGTIQTAVRAGLPFIGVPAQFEQETNVKSVIATSSRLSGAELPGAIVVSKNEVTETGEPVIRAVRVMLRFLSNFTESMKGLRGVSEEYSATDIVEGIVMDCIGWNHERRHKKTC